MMPLFGCISCISSIFPGFNRLKEKNDYMQINVIYTIYNIYIYPIYTTYISRCKSIRECWMKIMNKNTTNNNNSYGVQAGGESFSLSPCVSHTPPSVAPGQWHPSEPLGFVIVLPTKTDQLSLGT